MADRDRPTAQELRDLIDASRRGGASGRAACALAEAYLALGRPREAVEPLLVALEANPDDQDVRFTLARAYALQHQWREAQGELLRVVKIDRGHREGFALLGEVLLRRGDFERALPVLQHAQNLDPTSPHILNLLRRARANQPLDPPAPLPTPMEPREVRAVAPAAPVSSAPRTGRPSAAPAPMAFTPPRAAADERTMAELGAPAVAPLRAARPAPAPAARAERDDPTDLGAPPVMATPTPTPRPQPAAASAPSVRPRVVASANAKPKNPAAVALRQSASVGENYLNQLLTGGMLDVDGVRVPPVDYDLKPDRRWGRSTTRWFIAMFTVLVLGLGGGGFYWWYSNKLRAEAVAKLQRDAKTKIVAATPGGLSSALDDLKRALLKDNRNVKTFAYVGEATALDALLYGGEPSRVDTALKAAARDIKDFKQPGFREMVLGRAALDLARLATLETPGNSLKKLTGELDTFLAANPEDPWALWLRGKAADAAGKRAEARTFFGKAAAIEPGLAVALVSQADQLVDDGRLADALPLYQQVLDAEKNHPLAIVGRGLGRAENAVEPNAAIDEVSVYVDKKHGPRLAAYRALALVYANHALGDYAAAHTALIEANGASPGPTEPRFMARIAFAQYLRGDLAAAALARAKVAWYGTEKPEDDPKVLLVDTALLLASGNPTKALELAAKLDGVPARLLRAQALIDLGKGTDAISEADAILEVAPESRDARTLREWARALNGTAAQAAEPIAELEKQARGDKSKFSRHALGMALLASGNVADGKRRLQQALENISEDEPNPVAYRTHTALAELALREGNLVEAQTQLDLAIARNAGYFPTRALLAKVALAQKDYGKVLDAIRPIAQELGALPIDLELVQLEAAVSRPEATVDDKSLAAERLKALKEAGAPVAELTRIAALIDPALPETLGLPPPEGAEPKAPSRGSRRRRGR